MAARSPAVTVALIAIGNTETLGIDRVDLHARRRHERGEALRAAGARACAVMLAHRSGDQHERPFGGPSHRPRPPAPKTRRAGTRARRQTHRPRHRRRRLTPRVRLHPARHRRPPRRRGAARAISLMMSMRTRERPVRTQTRGDVAHDDPVRTALAQGRCDEPSRAARYSRRWCRCPPPRWGLPRAAPRERRRPFR